MQTRLTFEQLGPVNPKFPLVISVPHAGRDYTPEMADNARLPLAKLRGLEDRFADQLATLAVHEGIQTIVAKTPRLWIDLNRDEHEYDPLLIDGRTPSPALMSAKVRGGLGIIPARISKGGNIWHRRISAADLADRIAMHHRPYHATLHAMLGKAKATFGCAILLDLHSMPPIIRHDHGPAPDIVIGDSFGKAAHDRFTARAQAVAERFGFRTALNMPYAGGHILERHSQPDRGVHALQIEVDRRLYLDAAFESVSPTLGRLQQFVATLAIELSDEGLGAHYAQAAE